ncbi:hypothetical protein BU25DRAFT_27846 [Macroventuria anomochaeta]|uniref:Uncharacterized protein n=1 Tax=Macroventuria anomochaeta TaxID=301207 RepID=A0ACB6S7H9_9PLEO|nr:uncharacterized protein BU25DRAFT_27846 [Macroventuria anomochaeta]KAF2629169.1 hypothetical protein BU25DRAFT_27846 [Macroventuria anomochaeta]
MSSAMSFQIASTLFQWMFNESSAPADAECPARRASQQSQSRTHSHACSTSPITTITSPSSGLRSSSSSGRGDSRPRSPETSPLLGGKAFSPCQTQIQWETEQWEAQMDMNTERSRVVFPMLGSA